MKQIADFPSRTKQTPIRLEHLPDALWSTDVKIRFGHCDPAGIVYMPLFFDIFNGVIEDWYDQALRLGYHDFIAQRKVGLGYVNAHGDFFVPCMMGEFLRVAVELEQVGNSSFVVILHAFKNGMEALRGRLTVVTTCLKEHKAITLPDDLKAALLDYGAFRS